MNRFTFIGIYLVIYSITSQAQDTISRMVPATIIDGDTVPLVVMKSASVYPPYEFNSKRKEVKFTRLVYNVKKALPYARLAGVKFREIERGLDTLPGNRDRRKYIREAEDRLMNEFGDEVKDLTISQGKILIKLIYRETGNSSFEIIRELRGNFTAFIWQTVATLFGYDLKNSYNPEGEDREIEEIVLLIDEGYF